MSIHVFSNNRFYRSGVVSMSEHLNTLSEVRFQSFAAVNILCISAVKLYYAKNNNSPFMCSHLPEFVEVENLPPSSLEFGPQSGWFLTLQPKLYCITYCICWSAAEHSVTLLGPILGPKSYRLRKWAAAIIMAYDRLAQLVLMYRSEILIISFDCEWGNCVQVNVMFKLLCIFSVIWFLWTCAKSI